MAFSIRTLLSLLFSGFNYLQIPDMAPFYWSFRPSTNSDSSFCSTFALTTRCQRRENNRNGALLLPILATWYNYACFIHDRVRNRANAPVQPWSMADVLL